jgi:hypothetical protein
MTQAGGLIRQQQLTADLDGAPFLGPLITDVWS